MAGKKQMAKEAISPSDLILDGFRDLEGESRRVGVSIEELEKRRRGFGDFIRSERRRVNGSEGTRNESRISMSSISELPTEVICIVEIGRTSRKRLESLLPQLAKGLKMSEDNLRIELEKFLPSSRPSKGK